MTKPNKPLVLLYIERRVCRCGHIYQIPSRQLVVHDERGETIQRLDGPEALKGETVYYERKLQYLQTKATTCMMCFQEKPENSQKLAEIAEALRPPPVVPRVPRRPEPTQLSDNELFV